MRRCGRGRETYPVGLRSLGHLDFVVYLLVRAYQLWHEAGEFIRIIYSLGPGILILLVDRLTVRAYDFLVSNMGPRFWFWFFKSTIRGLFLFYVFGRLFAGECEISQTLKQQS